MLDLCRFRKKVRHSFKEVWKLPAWTERVPPVPNSGDESARQASEGAWGWGHCRGRGRGRLICVTPLFILSSGPSKAWCSHLSRARDEELESQITVVAVFPPEGPKGGILEVECRRLSPDGLENWEWFPLSKMWGERAFQVEGEPHDKIKAYQQKMWKGRWEKGSAKESWGPDCGTLWTPSLHWIQELLGLSEFWTVKYHQIGALGMWFWQWFVLWWEMRDWFGGIIVQIRLNDFK